jgi:tRNA pseudouridine55 synthase
LSGRRSRHRKEAPGPAGFLVVDKPAGVTSHDVVDAARRWLGTRRVGHLGTLDPQATGVLPLAVREATRLASFVDQGRKSYVGIVRLGIATDTQDGEGKVLRRFDGPLPDRQAIADALAAFRGDIEQIPPMFSAVKHGGVPLHRLARKGEHVQRSPKKVRIHRLEILRYDPPDLEIAVDCSPGTYVRTLASDLGEALSCGAYLHSLRRLRSGPFGEAEARTVEQLEADATAGRIEEHLVPAAAVLGLPTLTLATSAADRVRNGADLSPGSGLRAAPGDLVLALDESGALLAVLELRADRRLWPLRVLRPAES